MFLILSEFSGCFWSTSKKPGSMPVSNTPLPVSCPSIPSCQNTLMQQSGSPGGGEDVVAAMSTCSQEKYLKKMSGWIAGMILFLFLFLFCYYLFFYKYTF